jgi:hypothetical protein
MSINLKITSICVFMIGLQLLLKAVTVANAYTLATINIQVATAKYEPPDNGGTGDGGSAGR